MKIKKGFLCLAALMVCVAVLSACGQTEKGTDPAPPPVLNLPATDSPFQLGEPRYDQHLNAYYLDYGTFPRLDGVDNCLPLARALASHHLKLVEEDLKGFIVFNANPMLYFSNNTSAGQPRLGKQNIYMQDKPTDVVLSASPNEADIIAAKENGLELRVESVAMDAVVLFVSRENPVNNLTSEQLRGIYSGKITNWREVGGADLPIVVYQSKTPEARETLQALVMQGADWIDHPTVENTIPSGIPGGDSYTVSYPADYENTSQALGLGMMAGKAANAETKYLAIDGILPEMDTVQMGIYPLIVTYQAIARAADQDQGTGQFLNWMLSDEGRQCIRDAGYALPLHG